MIIQVKNNNEGSRGYEEIEIDVGSIHTYSDISHIIAVDGIKDILPLTRKSFKEVKKALIKNGLMYKFNHERKIK